MSDFGLSESKFSTWSGLVHDVKTCWKGGEKNNLAFWRGYFFGPQR